MTPYFINVNNLVIRLRPRFGPATEHIDLRAAELNARSINVLQTLLLEEPNAGGSPYASIGEGDLGALGYRERSYASS